MQHRHIVGDMQPEQLQQLLQELQQQLDAEQQEALAALQQHHSSTSNRPQGSRSSNLGSPDSLHVQKHKQLLGATADLKEAIDRASAGLSHQEQELQLLSEQLAQRSDAAEAAAIDQKLLAVRCQAISYSSMHNHNEVMQATAAETTINKPVGLCMVPLPLLLPICCACACATAGFSCWFPACCIVVAGSYSLPASTWYFLVLQEIQSRIEAAEAAISNTQQLLLDYDQMCQRAFQLSRKLSLSEAELVEVKGQLAHARAELAGAADELAEHRELQMQFDVQCQVMDGHGSSTLFMLLQLRCGSGSSRPIH